MAGPHPLTREILRKISPDPRWIRVMEQLLDMIPTDTDELLEIIQELQYEAGLAASRAQQALDSLSVNNYGVFYDTTDQFVLTVDTPTVIELNSTQVSNGVSLNGSQISVAKSGLYEIEVRVQL